MTPESQRIAIAEACGWHQKPMAQNGPLVWNDGQGFRNEYEIPDYLNDLNAMHEAEKIMTYDQWIDYSDEIWKVSSRDRVDGAPWDGYEILHATPAQRAEAFLRTLGLWKD